MVFEKSIINVYHIGFLLSFGKLFMFERKESELLMILYKTGLKGFDILYGFVWIFSTLEL